LICFKRVRSVAIEALKRARPFAARRQRQNQMSPALGTGRSFRLTHGQILPPVGNFVNFKLGPAEANQITAAGNKPLP
jgi:hypothetical protein